MLGLLRRHGVCDYHIFHDPDTDILFAVQHRKPGHSAETLPDDPLMKRWFAHMGDIMETDETGAPVMVPLVEVFHMD